MNSHPLTHEPGHLHLLVHSPPPHFSASLSRIGNHCPKFCIYCVIALK